MQIPSETHIDSMHSQQEQYKIDWDSFSDPVSKKYQYRTTGDPYHCTDPIPETFSIGFHSFIENPDQYSSDSTGK